MRGADLDLEGELRWKHFWSVGWDAKSWNLGEMDRRLEEPEKLFDSMEDALRGYLGQQGEKLFSRRKSMEEKKVLECSGEALTGSIGSPNPARGSKDSFYGRISYSDEGNIYAYFEITEDQKYGNLGGFIEQLMHDLKQ